MPQANLLELCKCKNRLNKKNWHLILKYVHIKIYRHQVVEVDLLSGALNLSKIDKEKTGNYFQASRGTLKSLASL